MRLAFTMNFQNFNEGIYNNWDAMRSECGMYVVQRPTRTQKNIRSLKNLYKLPQRSWEIKCIKK